MSHLSQGDLGFIRYPDERNYYLSGAKEFLAQGWSFFAGERSLWNGPLNLLWVALFQANLVWVRIANIALITFAGVPLWGLIRRKFSVGAAYLGLGLYLFQPALIHFNGTILTEPPFIALLVLSLWAFSKGEYKFHFLSGLLMAFASLVRPTTQLFPLYFLLFSVFISRCKGEKAWVKQSTLLFVGGALLVLLPYMGKNWVRHQKFGIANGSGAVMYLGNDLRTDGHEPVYSQFDFDTIETTWPQAHLDTEGDRRLTERAIARMQLHPLETLELMSRKFFRYIFGSPQAYFYPFADLRSFLRYTHGFSRWEALAQLTWISFCMAGLLCSFARIDWSRSINLFVGALLSYFVLLHTLLFPIARLALPFHVLSIPLVAFGMLKKPIESVLLGLLVFCSIGFIDAGRLRHQVSTNYAEYFSDSISLTESMKSNAHAIAFDSASSFHALAKEAKVEFEFVPKQIRTNQALIVSIKVPEKSKLSKAKLGVRLGRIGEEGGVRVVNEIDVEYTTNGRTFRVPLKVPKSWAGQGVRLELQLPKSARKGGARFSDLQFVSG
ncbi:MAG: glycosyltransferase family 39 protein [Bdellovibrionales bacterium]|nr:glycosyltransferase family 39 protein [Bdellovibrionales bacterium]